MKTKGLSALAVVAILLAAVLAPAMGLSLMNNSNSSANENESLNDSITTPDHDPETPIPNPSSSQPIEESNNNTNTTTDTDTEANANETEIIDDEIPLPPLSENVRIIGKDSFSANETPEFVIEIEQDFIDAISGAASGKPVEIQIYVEGCNGSRIELFVAEEEASPSSNISIYWVTIPNNKTGLETEEITPGIYTLVVVVGEQYVEHPFEWGLESEAKPEEALILPLSMPMPMNLSDNLKFFGNDSFSANETPEFVIEIQNDFIAFVGNLRDSEPAIQIHAEDSEGNRIEVIVEEISSSSNITNVSVYKVTIPNNKTGSKFKPGTYKLVVELGGQSIEYPFEWGPQPTIAPALSLTTAKKHFVLNENPVFKFKFNYKTKNESKAKAKTNETGLKALALGISEPKKALKIWVTPQETIKTAVYYKDELLDLEPEIEKIGEGDFSIKIPLQRAFRAGLYKLKVELVTDNKTYVEEEEFEWGLVSLNTRKSIYKPGETAEFILVVLDKAGHPVCDTDVSLAVTNPNNEKAVYSTADGTILPGNECGIYNADYPTEVGVEGNHTVDITALINGVKVDFSTYFLVQRDYEFDIIRTAQSKIDPTKQDRFDVAINVESFVGANTITVKEFVPAEFDLNTDADITEIGDTKILTWNRNLVGNKTSVRYSYAVPAIWPYLYALGPAEIGYGSETFTEARAWYVAVDPTYPSTPTAQNNTEVSTGETSYTTLKTITITKSGENWLKTEHEIKSDSTKSQTAHVKVMSSNSSAIYCENSTTNTSYTTFYCELDISSLQDGSQTFELQMKRDKGAGYSVYNRNWKLYLENIPPVVETPKTYNSSLLEKETFEVGENVTVRVNVTDVNGAPNIDKVLITIKNPEETVKADNATMTNISSITKGYIYEYNYTTMPIEPASIGTWTVEVYANDTSNAWDSNSTTFDVQDTQAPQWSDPQTNKTQIYQNDYVKFTANWTDDVALAGYKFSINQTGTWENSSFVPFSGTFNISENVTQITASAGTTVQWRFYANDTSNNTNVTDIQSFVVATPPPPPSTPYMIYGYVFYKNGTACNNPAVNVTNMNNSKEWTAKTNASYNYYRLLLSNGTDLNASEILRFKVRDSSGVQSKMFNHTVNETEVNNGGLFNFNITLEVPETPFMIYGWVFYENSSECINPTVNITNTNTSIIWQSETNASYNFYQLVLDTTNISAGNVLSLNATDGTEFNVTNHTVTQSDINKGGLFDFNLTLPTAVDTTPPEWRSQGQSVSQIPVGGSILLYAQGKDTGALDYALLATNETGTWHNWTGEYGSPMDMNDAVDTWKWSNFTWQNGSISAGTTVGWRIWYNDTANNWNKTAIMCFEVIAGAPPTVDSITITPDDEPAKDGVQINPNPGANKTVNISAVVSDSNGWDDVDTIVATITGPSTVADSPVNLTYVSNGTLMTATYNGTFNMSFYYANGTYTVDVTATDMSSLTGSNSTTFNYTTAIGLELDSSVINFSCSGPIDPGETSEVLGDEDMETLNNATVRNIGNVKIDVNVSGTNMTSAGNIITNNNIAVRIDNIPAVPNYYDMSVVRCFDVNMTVNASSLENADFKLFVPYGTPQGNYAGTITLTPVQS